MPKLHCAEEQLLGKQRKAGRQGAKLPCGNPFLITTPLRCSPVVSCGFSCDGLEGFLTAESLSDQQWRYSWYCVFLTVVGIVVNTVASLARVLEVEKPLLRYMYLPQVLWEEDLTLESKIRSAVDSLTVNSVF